MSEKLKVSVSRVLYPPETAEGATWFILSAQSEAGQVIAKGEMGWRPRQGEKLELTGKWSTYQGKREFKFSQAALDIPTDPRGMLHYVCEIASGVGASMEQLIWDLKGETWAAIGEGEIPRLSGKIYTGFMQALETAESDQAKGSAIAELLRAGCTMNMATAAYDKWEADTLGVVASDPYRLAELPNYGFSHVDGQIRMFYGIEDGDPRRIRAAIVYVLRQITESGSTLVPWDKLNSSCLHKLGGYQHLITRSVKEMFGDGTLRGFRDSRAVALAKDFRNESIIWQRIKE